MDHTFPNLALPALGPLESVGMRLVIPQRLINLLLGVEDERTILYDFLIER